MILGTAPGTVTVSSIRLFSNSTNNYREYGINDNTKLQILNGATLTLWANPADYSNTGLGVSTNGELIINNGGRLVLSNNHTQLINNGLTTNHGTIDTGGNISGGVVNNAPDGVINVLAGGSLDLQFGRLVNAGTVNMAAGSAVYAYSSDQAIDNSAGLITGGINEINGALLSTLAPNAGRVEITTGSVGTTAFSNNALTAGTFTFKTQQTTSGAGIIDVGGANVVFEQGGTFGSAVSAANITLGDGINASASTFNAGVTGNTTVLANNQTTFNADLNGDLTVAGQAQLGAGSTFAGSNITVQNTGTFTNNSANAINLNGGTFTNSGTSVNNGIINVTNGGGLNLAANVFTNNGTLSLDSAAQFSRGTGTLANAGGVINTHVNPLMSGLDQALTGNVNQVNVSGDLAGGSVNANGATGGTFTFADRQNAASINVAGANPALLNGGVFNGAVTASNILVGGDSTFNAAVSGNMDIASKTVMAASSSYSGGTIGVRSGAELDLVTRANMDDAFNATRLVDGSTMTITGSADAIAPAGLALDAATSGGLVVVNTDPGVTLGTGFDTRAASIRVDSATRFDGLVNTDGNLTANAGVYAGGATAASTDINGDTTFANQINTPVLRLGSSGSIAVSGPTIFGSAGANTFAIDGKVSTTSTDTIVFQGTGNIAYSRTALLSLSKTISTPSPGQIDFGGLSVSSDNDHLAAVVTRGDWQSGDVLFTNTQFSQSNPTDTDALYSMYNFGLANVILDGNSVVFGGYGKVADVVGKLFVDKSLPINANKINGMYMVDRVMDESPATSPISEGVKDIALQITQLLNHRETYAEGVLATGQALGEYGNASREALLTTTNQFQNRLNRRIEFNLDFHVLQQSAVSAHAAGSDSGYANLPGRRGSPGGFADPRGSVWADFHGG